MSWSGNGLQVGTSIVRMKDKACVEPPDWSLLCVSQVTAPWPSLTLSSDGAVSRPGCGYLVHQSGAKPEREPERLGLGLGLVFAG